MIKNREEYLKKIRELVDQYEKDICAMQLTSIASVGYHLEVDLKLLKNFLELTDKYLDVVSKRINDGEHIA